MHKPALLIVESPNKTAKIESMFPQRFKAMATVGHICDLPPNPKEGIGIDKVHIKGQYELSDRGSRVISSIKRYLKDNPGTEVFLGTDEDREGESIAAFVAMHLGLKDSKRMRFNAITKEKIEFAHTNATPIDWRAVASREARRLIDRIIGYTASPMLGRIVRQKGVAAGRVQTAVEALVIERERKIRAHKPERHYSVSLDMGGWGVSWLIPQNAVRTGIKPNSEYDIDDSSPRCFDQALAAKVAESRVLFVESCEETQEQRLPPPPLNTFALIQIADAVLGWDAEKTMQVAQKLFEPDGSGHGHITYHRTDSSNLEPGPAEEIRAWLSSKGLPVSTTRNTWKNKNSQAQEGHEAIRPAYIQIEDAGATDEQKALYKIIRERALYSQLSPAIYNVKKIVLLEAVSGSFTFTATARQLSDPGWLVTSVAKNPAMREETDEADSNAGGLPDLRPGTRLAANNGTCHVHTTKAPARYTMRNLTAKLEKLSIGRPATMVSLLKNVQSKGTIKVLKDKRLQATPLAEQCYDVLYPRFGFAHIGYTAELELALDQIASGHINGSELVKNVWNRLDADCSTVAG